MFTLKEFLLAKGKEVWGVSPNATVHETLKVMAEKDIGAVPVTEKGKIIGIFSERDFARIASSLKQFDLKLPIRRYMTKKVLHVSPNNSMEDCMNIMTTHRIRHLPILEDDKIIGIVTIGDVVKHLLQEQKFILTKVLDAIEEGKNNLRTNVRFNIEHNVLPLVRELARKHPEDSPPFHLLEEHLNKISSEFYRKLVSADFNFTPTEISIIKLIKANYREKEISEFLNISISTVKKHKYAIRGKLGIRHKSGNILSHLDGIE